MLESVYKTKLNKKLRQMFPGCVILVNDSAFMQGVPDRTIFYGTKWAMLEVKRKKPTSPDDFEPNQEWYIEMFDKMSFCACIYPENETEVLRAIQLALQP
jgi:hypothetical protein